MAILLPVLIVVLALDVFCFVDLHRAEEVAYLPKSAWVILIIVIHFFGAIAYLIFGRKRRAGTWTDLRARADRLSVVGRLRFSTRLCVPICRTRPAFWAKQWLIVGRTG